MDAVVDLERLQARSMAQDGDYSAGQVFSFKKTAVHALHPDGAGLMGGIARQPTTFLAKFERHLALKLDVRNPVYVT
jgi:hypothetical protein